MRAARLVRILLLLQSRGRLTAAHLAAELEVSERTVYRDLADLGAAGVPVVGERGAGGGYVLLDGYRTNLTGLTPEEAEALLLTGAPAPAAAIGLGARLASARLKLLAAVPAALQETAVRAEQRFFLDPTGWAHAVSAAPGPLVEIADAVWRDRRLRIVHRRRNGRISEREVDPLGLVHKTGTWYLVAGTARVYRVERILAAAETGSTADRPAGFDLAGFWATWEADYATGLPVFRVEVRLGPRASAFRDSLGNFAPRSATLLVDEHDGWQRQELVFDDPWMATTALMALAPEVEVIAPDDLRERLGVVARALASRCEPLPNATG